MIRALLLAFGLLAGAQEPTEPLPTPAGVPVFTSGQGGYHTYRIPALAVTPKATLLAFCEGRKHAWDDAGDIELLVRRSTDGGRTWSAPQVVWDDGSNTCGNPCVAVDPRTGTLWLLSTWNRGDDHESQIIQQTSKDTRRVFVLSSRDEGRTWSRPREITADVKNPAWTWYATWKDQRIDPQLVEPRCQAAIERLRWPSKGQPGVLLFSNPAHPSKRVQLTVRASLDDGQTWPLSRVLFQGPSGYSDLAVLKDGRIGCLFEAGPRNLAEGIVFEAFALERLTRPQ